MDGGVGVGAQKAAAAEHRAETSRSGDMQLMVVRHAHRRQRAGAATIITATAFHRRQLSMMMEAVMPFISIGMDWAVVVGKCPAGSWFGIIGTETSGSSSRAAIHPLLVAALTGTRVGTMMVMVRVFTWTVMMCAATMEKDCRIGGSKEGQAAVVGVHDVAPSGCTTNAAMYLSLAAAAATPRT